MRITQSMISSNSLRNIQNSYSRLSKLDEQVASGKKFSKPSDSPVAAMRAMGYRTDLGRVQQYQENIGEVENWMDSTDDALDNAVLALQRIRELTVKASNEGAVEGESKSYIATEIKQLKEQIIAIGDTQVGGKYIFSGIKTDQRPSERNFEDADGEIFLEVSTGIKLPLNANGTELFGDFMDDNGIINSLITDLEDPDVTEGTITNHLAALDNQINGFLKERSNIGAKQNRVELMATRLDNQEVFSTRILSDNEDIELEQVIMDLTMQESVHRAGLSIGAKIMQPSLMDFLR